MSSTINQVTESTIGKQNNVSDVYPLNQKVSQISLTDLTNSLYGITSGLQKAMKHNLDDKIDMYFTQIGVKSCDACTNSTNNQDYTINDASNQDQIIKPEDLVLRKRCLVPVYVPNMICVKTCDREIMIPKISLAPQDMLQLSEYKASFSVNIDDIVNQENQCDSLNKQYDRVSFDQKNVNINFRHQDEHTIAIDMTFKVTPIDGTKLLQEALTRQI